MELRQIEYFVAVAEELHFGRAAKRLHLAQPALSRQIQNLEEDLGVQLFSRTKRRVQLTAAGSVFLDQSRSVLARLDEAKKATQRAARGQTGWLGIGFVESATYDVLPAAFKLFRQRSPNVELTLFEMTSTEQLQALREKRIHVAFVRPPIDGEGLTLETVRRESLVVLLPDGHPLAERRSIPVRALADEPFILFPHHPGPTWVDFIQGLCQRAGFEPRVVQMTREFQTAISLVSAGVGIAIGPASIEGFKRKGVAYQRLTGQGVWTELIAAYRDDYSSPVLDDFMIAVRETVRQLKQK